jgi:hypothetical protein
MFHNLKVALLLKKGWRSLLYARPHVSTTQPHWHSSNSRVPTYSRHTHAPALTHSVLTTPTYTHCHAYTTYAAAIIDYSDLYCHLLLLYCLLQLQFNLLPLLFHQWVVKTAQYITGTVLPPIQDIYSKRCPRKERSIIKDPSHELFLGRHYWSMRSDTNRLRDSLYLTHQTAEHLNWTDHLLWFSSPKHTCTHSSTQPNTYTFILHRQTSQLLLPDSDCPARLIHRAPLPLSPIQV